MRPENIIKDRRCRWLCGYLFDLRGAAAGSHATALPPSRKEAMALSSRCHSCLFAGNPKRNQLGLSGKVRTKIPARPK